MIKKYGYPIISKDVSESVNTARNCPNGRTAEKFNPNSDYYSDRYKLVKYTYLLDAPFKISKKCCYAMKKRPATQYQKESNKRPIVGSMAYESELRRTDWIKHGCNIFDSHNPISKPMSFWKEQDILKFIVKFDIPLASVYGEIISDENGRLSTTGWDRTGCMFCGFGCHLEKEPNRFQRLKQTHPKVWEYAMKPYEEGGLGMGEVLDFIGVKKE